MVLRVGPLFGNSPRPDKAVTEGPLSHYANQTSLDLAQNYNSILDVRAQNVAGG